MTAALCTAAGRLGKAALGCGRAVVTKGAWARVLSMCCLFHQEIWGVESGSKQYVHAVADFRLGEFFKSEWSIGSLQSSVSGGCPAVLLPSFQGGPFIECLFLLRTQQPVAQLI